MCNSCNPQIIFKEKCNIRLSINVILKFIRLYTLFMTAKRAKINSELVGLWL